MFIIKWRRRGSFTYTKGLLEYTSIEVAARQVAQWQSLFKNNLYYIEQIS